MGWFKHVRKALSVMAILLDFFNHAMADGVITVAEMSDVITRLGEVFDFPVIIKFDPVTVEGAKEIGEVVGTLEMITPPANL